MKKTTKSLGEYKLIDVDASNIDNVLETYLSNKEYFILSGGSPAAIENVHNDMKESPSGTTKEQKQYQLIESKEQYIGVIDYILNYPNFYSVYIGFFIIKGSFQGLGHGNKIIHQFEIYLKSLGFKRIRLGVLDNNNAGLKFWRQAGFRIIKEMKSTIHPEKDWFVKIMEKNI